MKKIIVVVALVFVALTSFTSISNEKVIHENNTASVVVDFDGSVDVSKSVLNWKGFKPTGSHAGTVLLKEGSMKMKRGKLKGGTFVIDMSTIKEDKGSKRLERHLASADFFDVKVYPTATFVITKVKRSYGKTSVTGDLTIKDVTKSITIPASVAVVDGQVTFKSETFKINRADYNVKYKSKSFFNNLKDKFIDDMMEISFEVKGTI